MKCICIGADTVIVQCEKKESGRILCESRHLFLLFLCVRQAKTFYYYCGGFEYKKAPFTGNRADAHSSCKGSKIPAPVQKLGVPQTLEYFQRMQDRITNFVTANSGISYERFMQLAMNTQELVMDVGTVLDGDEAVAEGLIDTLGSLHDAMDCLDKMITAEKNKQRAKPRKGKKSL